MDKLAEIRAEMAAALSQIPGLQASGYALANMTPPTAVVQPGPVEYHQAMQRGHSDWNMRVRVYAGTVSDIGAQKRLDGFLAETGDESIVDVLEGWTPTVWHDLTVESCDGYQEYAKADGTVYLGAEWSVLVMAEDN